MKLAWECIVNNTVVASFLVTTFYGSIEKLEKNYTNALKGLRNFSGLRSRSIDETETVFLSTLLIKIAKSSPFDNPVLIILSAKMYKTRNIYTDPVNISSLFIDYIIIIATILLFPNFCFIFYHIEDIYSFDGMAIYYSFIMPVIGHWI